MTISNALLWCHHQILLLLTHRRSLMSKSAPYLVLIETSGNQHYIFATNKLRENLGASELTRNAGERWVIDTVQAITGKPLPGLSSDEKIIHNTAQHRTALRNQLSIFDSPTSDDSPVNVEIILAASGKALLLTREHSTAKSIVQQLTAKALQQAPGLDLRGAILPIPPEAFEETFEGRKTTPSAFADSFNTLLRNIHERHAYIHAKGPSNANRFLRLPIIANCKTSGLPASTLHKEPGSSDTATDSRNSFQPRSAVSLAKDNKTVRETTGKRLEELLKHDNIKDKNWKFPVNSSELEQHLNQVNTENSWLSIVHIDGNGLGQIFLNFATHLAKLAPILEESASEPTSIEQKFKHVFSHLREFSIELDCCTENAFRTALLETFDDYPFPDKGNRFLPLVPLILGGDDLTILCDGRKALTFTVSFLKAFEVETQKSTIIAPIAKAALKQEHLSACAGIAIIKPHFPFSIGYQLAESLIKSAKEVKQKIQYKTATSDQLDPYPSSALDFHILYDSSNVNLSDIRQKLTLNESSTTTQLTNKPYVITPTDTPADISAASQDWLNQHRWQHFHQAVTEVKAFQKDSKLRASDDSSNDRSKPSLPRTQAYALRQTLFQGMGPANAYLKMLTARYHLSPENSCLIHGNAKTPTLFQTVVKHPTVPLSTSPSSSAPPPNNSSKQDYLTNYLDSIDAADFL